MKYYTIDNFPYDEVEKMPPLPRPRYSRYRYRYLDCVSAFDIETSNIDEIEQSVMYIWQMQIEEYTIIGRKWDEFKTFLKNLERRLGDCRMVIFIHNLSFEWQFLKSVLDVDDVFSMDDRKVLTFRSGQFEFRCSYLHSNMKLEKFLEKMQVENKKLDYDYSKKRYWFTELSDDELAYCINDVKGLVQAIKKEMHLENRNLYNLPKTSTGFIREMSQEVLKPYSRAIHKWLPDEEVFHGLRNAFRGG